MMIMAALDGDPLVGLASAEPIECVAFVESASSRDQVFGAKLILGNAPRS
jgi:hypothetical protein